MWPCTQQQIRVVMPTGRGHHNYVLACSDMNKHIVCYIRVHHHHNHNHNHTPHHTRTTQAHTTHTPHTTHTTRGHRLGASFAIFRANSSSPVSSVCTTATVDTGGDLANITRAAEPDAKTAQRVHQASAASASAHIPSKLSKTRFLVFWATASGLWRWA